MRVLRIAHQAQLLYKRSGRAKDHGELEDYYTPNRILWPARGLDPVGQHARASIQAQYLIDAMRGEEIPYESGSQAEPSMHQGNLFNE
jgi:hypothetical protein